jgi:type II secretory pathway component GspD/PulD (secretin)
VQSIVEQFDVTSLSAPLPRAEPLPQSGQPNFYLYKPVSLPVEDLEKLMQDFADNVRSSGLSDPELFSAITSMRTVEKTQSLVFTGTPKALDQVKELLKAFDIPANLKNKPVAPPAEPAIQAIDNTSFLVYKLQFHKGDEIQTALKQIAKDLINTNAPVNQNLLNSINSIQWLDVTNSLLSSGDQETLVRLKELIKNLDIPLKQVFIEILVIETTLSNALLFGLEWGGNYKFNEKFGISSFNTVPPPNQQATFPDQFISKLSGLAPPDSPTPVGNIPQHPLHRLFCQQYDKRRHDFDIKY